MSTLRNPVGPKDRKVYLRRRLLVLAGFLAIIAVIVLVIVKPGSSGRANTNTEVEVPADLNGNATPEANADPDATPKCAASQLTVLPLTDSADYASDAFPELSLSVENTGEAACAAELGTASMEFSVSSGDDQVWRSVDCQESPESLSVILEPSEPLVTEAVLWDRTRSSAETCDITRDPVPAGGATYHLRVSVGGVQGTGTAQFLLY